MLYIFLLFLAMALWMSKLYYILFKIANFSIELIINYNFLFFRYVLYSIWKLYFNIRFILILCGFAGLFTTTLFVFLTRPTCSGCSHIISIIYTYSIIRISLFIKLGNICIICIYDITCTTSISLTWTYCGQCPHPFIWYEYIIFLFFIQCTIDIIYFKIPHLLASSFYND